MNTSAGIFTNMKQHTHIAKKNEITSLRSNSHYEVILQLLLYYPSEICLWINQSFLYPFHWEGRY